MRNILQTRSVIVLFAILVVGPNSVAPQSARPAATLESYYRARRVLVSGIEALGGEQALRSIRNVTRHMKGNWLDTGQGSRPYRGPAPTTKLPPSHERDIMLSYIDYFGNRWLESLDESNLAGDRALQTDVVTSDRGFDSLVYMKEKPLHSPFSADDLGTMRARKFRRYPEGLLLMALDRAESLQLIGVAQNSGVRQDVISFADPAGVRVSLYFDQRTHLLTKSETLRDHSVFGDTTTDILFSDYRRVNDVRLPFRYIDRVGGIPTQEYRVDTVEINSAGPESTFQPPVDYVSVVADPPAPAVTSISPNLYLIRGSYNVMFANFRDYVMVFEAPLNRKYTETCMSLVNQTLPGKPIRWLVATHFHHDHLAGIGTYVDAKIPILTTPDAEWVIKRASRSRRTIRSGSRFHARPIIQNLTTERTFDDGVQRVEVFNLGPTEHVAQMLIVYFSRERTLFVADVFDVSSTELPIAVDDTVKLANRLQQLGITVDRIIPVHGVPATADTLQKALLTRAKYFPPTPRGSREE